MIFLLLCTIDQFRCHIAGFVTLGMLFQEVWKEEDLEDGKHDEQFDKDDSPQRLAEAHGSETFVIQVKGLVKKTFLVHRRSIWSQIYIKYLMNPNI